MHWDAIQLLGLAGSRQVLHHEEHDHTGDDHPPDHEVLVLESPLLNEPHHRVGQAQHVGNVQDLLLSPLGRQGERGKQRSTRCAKVGRCQYDMGLVQHTVARAPWKNITLTRANDF